MPLVTITSNEPKTDDTLEQLEAYLSELDPDDETYELMQSVAIRFAKQKKFIEDVIRCPLEWFGSQQTKLLKRAAEEALV